MIRNEIKNTDEKGGNIKKKKKKKYKLLHRDFGKIQSLR